MRLSIKAVLIGTIVGLQIATVAAILFSSMATTRGALLGHGQHLMQAAAHNVLDQAQEFLRPAAEAAALTQRLATTGIVPHDDVAALERYFIETLALHPEFSGIYFGGGDGAFHFVSRSAEKTPGGLRTKLITVSDGRRDVALRWRDAGGRVVAEASDPKDSFDPRQRPWFRRAVLEGRLVWTDPYVFFSSRQPGITVAAPVRDADGDIIGVVGVDIEISDVSAFLAQLQRDTGNSAVILSRDGDVIAHPDAGKIRMPKGDASGGLRFARIDELDDPLTREAVRALDGPLAQVSRADRTTFRNFTLNGTEHLAAFIAMPEEPRPWVIAVHAPASLYLGGLTAMRDTNVYIALAIAALAIAVGLAVSRIIARPIVQLRADAQAVGEGRFPEAAAQDSSIDEVCQTLHAFHTMLAGLRRAQDELEQANQALEARVDARTGELRQEIALRERIAEDLRQAKDQADEASRAKSHFLSSMSHELRTPLNAILGFAQLLQLDSETLTPEQADWVDHIVDSGKHLLDLVSQVLDLAKIEDGAIGMSIEELRVEQVVEESLVIARTLAARQDIALRLDPLPQPLPTVRGDFTRLKQSLLNLLSNAIKYNRSGGRVDLRVSLRPGSVRIEVADTGVGIPESEHDLLFVPFNRLHGTRDLVDGAGIGLAITKQLIEMMGGRVGFSSIPGQGSTFWLELPTVVRRAAVRERGGNVTVLYVEDNVSNQKLMQEVLVRFGHYSMLQAGSAEAGLDLARQHRPDVIIMDINLPGMDGYAALAELRRDGRTKDIPVIALTANALPSDRDRALAAGFDAYVAKPLDVQEVLSAMSRMQAA